MTAAPDPIDARKTNARAWFEALQLKICAAFEELAAY